MAWPLRGIARRSSRPKVWYTNARRINPSRGPLSPAAPLAIDAACCSRSGRRLLAIGPREVSTSPATPTHYHIQRQCRTTDGVREHGPAGPARHALVRPEAAAPRTEGWARRAVQPTAGLWPRHGQAEAAPPARPALFRPRSHAIQTCLIYQSPPRRANSSSPSARPSSASLRASSAASGGCAARTGQAARRPAQHARLQHFPLQWGTATRSGASYPSRSLEPNQRAPRPPMPRPRSVRRWWVRKLKRRGAPNRRPAAYSAERDGGGRRPAGVGSVSAGRPCILNDVVLPAGKKAAGVVLVSQRRLGCGGVECCLSLVRQGMTSAP